MYKNKKLSERVSTREHAQSERASACALHARAQNDWLVVLPQS